MPTARVRGEWANRIFAEYRSAAITSELTLWLIRIGASPDLIDDALRITGDELVHARMSHEVFAAAGGEASKLAPIDRDGLGIDRNPEEPLEHAVVRAAVQTFCLGETIAVPLFSHLRAGCTEPTARATLDRILFDEVRHRDFGWELLGWLLELPGAAKFREQVEGELPLHLAGLERAYGNAEAKEGSPSAPPVTDEERTWGLAEPSEYAEILVRSIDRDFSPRFARLGIDALAAWESRPR